MSFATLGRSVIPSELPSTSGRSEAVGRGFHGRLMRNVPDRMHTPARVASLGASHDAIRPVAGVPTILCSSLGKERKKLAKVLKSHRKVLEKRLAALSSTEVDAPMLSELLTELRTLTSRLQHQRATELLYKEDSDSSESDDDECTTRSSSSLCTRRAASDAPSITTTGFPMAHDDHSTNSTSMVISGLSGQLEVPVPAPSEGWDWNDEEFRSARFEGTGGRVLVCTGGKCQRKGATEVLKAVCALADGNPAIEVVPCKCVGKCSEGAALRMRPAGAPCVTYTQVQPGRLPEMFGEHFGARELQAAAAPVSCCVECQQ